MVDWKKCSEGERWVEGLGLDKVGERISLFLAV
jgi:hypothetical protein